MTYSAFSSWHQVTGVPGVDKIEVEIEGTGEIVRVGKKEVFLLEEAELTSRPFERAEVQNSNANSTHGKGEENEEGSSRRSRSSSSEKKKKKKKRRREEEGDDREGKSSSSRKKKKSRGDDEGPSSKSWLQPYIRVKIVTEKSLGGNGRSFFRKRGLVVKVNNYGEAILRMDSGDVLEGESWSRIGMEV